MTTVVMVPFVASVLLAVLSHVLVSRVRPAAAVWALTASMPTLALSTLGAVVVLACPLPARVPIVAMVGRWAPSAVASHAPVAPVVSAVAIVVLGWLVSRMWTEAGRLLRDVRSAIRAGALRWSGSDVVVVEDPVPHAHALSLGLLSRGKVVVSSSLVELLDVEERQAVIAHERAHVHQRHALLLTIARISAAMNPLLLPTLDDFRFALERSADEAAAATTIREALATGIAKAALAAVTTPTAPVTAFALHRHAVAERVAALLEDPTDRTRPAWALGWVAVVSAAAIAWTLHDTERFFEAVRLLSRR